MKQAEVIECASFLKSEGIDRVDAGIVLGTGLSAFIGEMTIDKILPYEKVPHFPVSTVEFHKGQLVYGRVGEKMVLAMQGRFHYYEGYSMQEITFPVRVMKELGTAYLLLSNAAGGINPSFKKGDLVLLEDHINFLPDNPLRGLADPELGPRFPDMSAPYDRKLLKKLADVFANAGLQLKIGTYAAVMGPNLETRAEYRFLRNSGADLVGMSTVPEVIVANQVGLPCAAISVVTDECDPDNLQPVDIQDIIAVAVKADLVLSKVLVEVIRCYAPFNDEL